MKKTLIALMLALILVLVIAIPVAAKGGKNDSCITIQDGVLVYAEGHYLGGDPLQVGYDIFGYNYQCHMFNGTYANVYLGRPPQGLPPYEGDDGAYYQRLVNEGFAETTEEAEELVLGRWYWPYRDVQLVMKWNDAWLSNKDCDIDGVLDRHYGFDSYIGSGAWETNHQSGSYEVDGKIYKWNYFLKIVAVPKDAYVEDGYWYTADGKKIGPVIWGDHARILQVYNDQGTDDHPIEYLSPAGPGLGAYK